MIKAVVDTNVFVSSFIGGNPRKIIDLWKSGELTLCLSKPIIDEYIEVLRRLGLQNEKEFDELIGLFAHGYHVVFTAKTPELHIVERIGSFIDDLVNRNRIPRIIYLIAMMPRIMMTMAGERSTNTPTTSLGLTWYSSRKKWAS